MIKSICLVLLLFFVISAENIDTTRIRFTLNPLDLFLNTSVDINAEYYLNGKNSISLEPNIIFTKYSTKPGLLFDYRHYFWNYEFIFLTEKIGISTIKMQYKEYNGNDLVRNETDAIYGFSFSTGIGIIQNHKPGLSIGLSASIGYHNPISNPTPEFKKIMEQEDLSMSDINPIQFIFEIYIGWIFKKTLTSR